MPISAARVVACKQGMRDISGFSRYAILSRQRAVLSSARFAPRAVLGNSVSTITLNSASYTVFTLVSPPYETCKVSSVISAKSLGVSKGYMASASESILSDLPGDSQSCSHRKCGEPTMSVNSAAAYGMYPQEVALHDVVHTLNQAGFENEDICMMLAPTHPIATIVREASILNAEREASAVTAGLIGWLSEFGAVVIPTVGFFIRSQAFFHALVVAKDAPALCGSTKTLVGLGFPENDAERFETQLREVGVLVYVSCAESAKTGWAREMLLRTGARETATLEKGMYAGLAA
jgi:hypothetical protein